jgi:hypothetical protein
MKKDGINNTLQFILKETTPILELGNKSTIEESDKKLLRGTIINGQLKTRIVNIDGKKIPFKFIQLQDKKGYISPQVVNLYIGKFANFTEAENEEEITQETEPYQKPKKTRNFIINYGLPVVGGAIGYFIAKKTDADEKKMIGFILFFGLLGFLPRYLYKK